MVSRHSVFHDSHLFCFLGRYCAQERVYRLEFVSNQDFSDSEFFKWKEDMTLTSHDLPTVQHIESKLKDIKNTVGYSYKDDDIAQVGFGGENM